MADYSEVLAENPKGKLVFANDELIISSKQQQGGGWDTPKLRFVSGNGGLGAISWNEPAGNEGGKERLLLIGSVGDGFAHFMNPTGASDDAAMQRLVDVHFNGATYHVPIVGQAVGAPRRIALRAVANSRYVCAENAGAQPLIANRFAPGPWEQFDLVVVE